MSETATKRLANASRAAAFVQDGEFAQRAHSLMGPTSPASFPTSPSSPKISLHSCMDWLRHVHRMSLLVCRQVRDGEERSLRFETGKVPHPRWMRHLVKYG